MIEVNLRKYRFRKTILYVHFKFFININNASQIIIFFFHSLFSFIFVTFEWYFINFYFSSFLRKKTQIFIIISPLLSNEVFPFFRGVGGGWKCLAKIVPFFCSSSSIFSCLASIKGMEKILISLKILEKKFIKTIIKNNYSFI